MMLRLLIIIYMYKLVQFYNLDIYFFYSNKYQINFS